VNFGSSAVSKLLVVLSGAALGGAVVTTATALTNPHREPVIHQRPALVIAPAPDQYFPTPPHVQPPAPIRLLIPSLGVSAAVDSLGINQDYSLEAPAGVADVGWYRLGSSPGTPGDAIISGHRGYPGGIPAVFNDIYRLHAGDELDVQLADGNTTRFAVDRVLTTPYRNIPDGFFATDGAPRLTLVTCTGDFNYRDLTYSDRLVVEATAIA
jgi:sortase (surface protein transpeptidase)